MSHNSKKIGLKKLSTKQNSKLTNKLKSNNDSLSHKFGSFISSSNQNGNKDESLISLGFTTKIVLSPESDTDCFKFSKKKMCVKKDLVEISSLSRVPSDSKLLELEDQEIKEDKEQTNSNETCSKYVRVSNLFDDSSSVFQSNTTNSTQSIDKIDEPVFIKALSENLGTSKDKKEEINSTYEDSITIPEMVVNEPVVIGQNTGDESVQQSQTINQCPICLKTVSKYVSHMKSCANKNKLNTQQLLSALKLHKKQLAERKKLGLNNPAPTYRARVSPKRSRANVNKRVGDVNLQLAMALSASLRSAEEDEVIQEAGALEAAGLMDEAGQRLGTLEQFGFASAVAPQQRRVQGSSKSRLPLPSLLLGRMKEERERIVTEKIAIVLISEEENFILDTFSTKEPNMKSKSLLKAWDKDCRLWVKAQCQPEEDRSGFYVHGLSEFVSPSKAEVGAALRRLSQLPGRLNTPPDKDDFCDVTSNPKTPSLEDTTYELSTPTRLLETTHCLETIPTVFKNSSLVEMKDKLSIDWKQLVNNPELSDLDIKCEDGNIPAHKLVFLVRCPKALQLISEESSKNVIMLETCSKSAAIALLEFVYAGSLSTILRLDEEDIKKLHKVVDSLELYELKIHLTRLDESRRIVGNNKSKNVKLKQNLFGTTRESLFDICRKEHVRPLKNVCSQIERSSLESNSKSLQELEPCDSINSQLTSLSSDRMSPDMFGESIVVANKSFTQQTQHYLDELASLVGKSTGIIEDKSCVSNESYFSKAENVVANDDFSSGPLVIESASGKRKALEKSFSDDEESAISKRVRSDHFSALSGKSDKEDVFDLTQSSKSSNEDTKEADLQEIRVDLEKNHEVLLIDDSDSCEILMGDSMEGLTQKNPSIPKSPTNISTSEKTPILQNQSAHQEYFDPAWDGYDDYLHFNYTPKTSPINSFRDKSSELKRSQNLSREKSFDLLSLSPKTPHTQRVQKSLLFTPKTSSDVNYISSDSNSPKKLSQKTLDKYSWKLNKIASETELKNLQQSRDISSSTINNCYENLCSPFESRDVNSKKSPLSPTATYSLKYKLRENALKSSCSQNSVVNSEKLPLKRDSLTAMQRLLDDSLEINDSILRTAEAMFEAENEEPKEKEDESMTPVTSALHQSKQIDRNICETKGNSVITPSSEIISYDNTTPLPDYSAMKTPSLKRELSKFGLKPSLGKRKAKLMLRYIYDQTHPFVPDPGGAKGEKVEVFKQPSGQPPRSPANSPRKAERELNLVDSESDTEESCSQKSTSSISSSVTLPEESFCEFDDVLTQEVCNFGDMKSAIRSLIVNNADLHRKVLMYEPIFFEEFMTMLKANGVKSKTNDVMDYLDEQCITFRTNSWKATNEKRRQKNLKKAKSQDETFNRRKKAINNTCSLPSEQPNPGKKRGRPKKAQTEDL